jgi:hypothetical protein
VPWLFCRTSRMLISGDIGGMMKLSTEQLTSSSIGETVCRCASRWSVGCQESLATRGMVLAFKGKKKRPWIGRR